jgi:diadenosine tetraphosphate (Ap4A) HIT family hydrolase
MESNITPNPQYKQITVDVPEERVDEFNAFVERFLAGPGGRRRGGRHGRHGRGRHVHVHVHTHGQGQGHGRGCGRRGERAEQAQQAEQGQPAEQREPSTETTEI